MKNGVAISDRVFIPPEEERSNPPLNSSRSSNRRLERMDLTTLGGGYLSQAYELDAGSILPVVDYREKDAPHSVRFHILLLAARPATGNLNVCLADVELDARLSPC